MSTFREDVEALLDDKEFRESLVRWLHFHMCAAQNLPWESGDVCDDCYLAVDAELLTQIGSRIDALLAAHSIQPPGAREKALRELVANQRRKDEIIHPYEVEEILDQFPEPEPQPGAREKALRELRDRLNTMTQVTPKVYIANVAYELTAILDQFPEPEHHK